MGWYRFPVAAPARLRPSRETVVAPAAFAMGCVAQRVLRRSADKWCGRWGLLPDACSVPGFGIGTAFAALLDVFEDCSRRSDSFCCVESKAVHGPKSTAYIEQL